MKTLIIATLFDDFPKRDLLFLAAAAGCIVGLALWKGSRERPLTALCGLFVIALAFKYSEELSFPFDLLVWAAALAVLRAARHMVDLEPKTWLQRVQGKIASMQEPKNKEPGQ